MEGEPSPSGAGVLTELQSLCGHRDRAWHVAWSPSGDMLASCSGDKTVRVWAKDPGSGRWHCTAVLEDMHTRTVRSCCWSPDSRHLATASFDRTTAIWQVQRGVWEHVAMLEGHESEVKCVAWNPNGSLIATCSRDKTVWVWEAAPGNEYEVVDVKHGHSQDVKRVVWHPSGEVLASCSYDDSIKLWVDNDDEWVCAQTLSGPEVGHGSTVWDLAFNRDGTRMASVSDDTTLKLWDCEREYGELQWKLLTTLAGVHGGTVFSVDWSPQGLLATGCSDNAIRIFEEAGPGGEATGVRELFAQGAGAASIRLLTCAEGAHAEDVNCVRWHPTDATLLASACDDGTIKLWRYSAAA